MKTHTMKVTGMHCPACEIIVADTVVEAGVATQAQALLSKNQLTVTGEWESEQALESQIQTLLTPLGYGLETQASSKDRVLRDRLLGVALGLGFLGLLFLIRFLGAETLFRPEKLDLPEVFILGLLASVSSCFALVGGLLVSYTLSLRKASPQKLWVGLGGFHLARLVGFALLGAALGSVGEALQPDFTATLALMVAAGVLMVLYGLRMVGGLRWGGGKGHIARKFKSWSENGRVLTGVLLGAGTFFLPCGFTQSVQFQAVLTGEPGVSASLMAVFALGTLPVLALVSVTLAKGERGMNSTVITLASGILLLGLGGQQLWNALQASGLMAASF